MAINSNENKFYKNCNMSTIEKLFKSFKLTSNMYINHIGTNGNRNCKLCNPVTGHFCSEGQKLALIKTSDEFDIINYFLKENSERKLNNIYNNNEIVDVLSNQLFIYNDAFYSLFAMFFGERDDFYSKNKSYEDYSQEHIFTFSNTDKFLHNIIKECHNKIYIGYNYIDIITTNAENFLFENNIDIKNALSVVMSERDRLNFYKFLYQKQYPYQKKNIQNFSM